MSLMEPIADDRRPCPRDSIDTDPAQTTQISPFTQPGDWVVLHTKSRQEKALSLDLAARQIPCFLPLRKEIRYYGKRKCVVELPIFSNYLFIKGQNEQVYLADRTKRVANIIRCPDQQKITWELHRAESFGKTARPTFAPMNHF